MAGEADALICRCTPALAEERVVHVDRLGAGAVPHRRACPALLVERGGCALELEIKRPRFCRVLGAARARHDRDAARRRPPQRDLRGRAPELGRDARDGRAVERARGRARERGARGRARAAAGRRRRRVRLQRDRVLAAHADDAEVAVEAVVPELHDRRRRRARRREDPRLRGRVVGDADAARAAATRGARPSSARHVPARAPRRVGAWSRHGRVPVARGGRVPVAGPHHEHEVGVVRAEPAAATLAEPARRALAAAVRGRRDHDEEELRADARRAHAAGDGLPRRAGRARVRVDAAAAEPERPLDDL